jgi:hypothetical protein
MSPRSILFLIAICSVGVSGISTYFSVRRIAEPEWWIICTTVVFSMLIFWWYWLDSESRSYRRSALLSMAIVAIALFAVPYYVLRSRAKGERLRALKKLVGFVGILVLASAFGGSVVGWLG